MLIPTKKYSVQKYSIFFCGKKYVCRKIVKIRFLKKLRMGGVGGGGHMK